ncbi:unnamed protein product, partial [Vitis vinifera]|uniref:Uncharacterized protein n=1 Tax=Vitis vinifera TaxID=29760 RepID=D7SST7_VITVI
MTGTCTSGWYTGGWPCICGALMERQLACNCDCFAGAELTFSSSLLNSTIDCFQSHLVCPYTLIMKSLTQSSVSCSITLNSLTQIWQNALILSISPVTLVTSFTGLISDAI